MLVKSKLITSMTVYGTIQAQMTLGGQSTGSTGNTYVSVDEVTATATEIQSGLQSLSLFYNNPINSGSDVPGLFMTDGKQVPGVGFHPLANLFAGTAGFATGGLLTLTPPQAGGGPASVGFDATTYAPLGSLTAYAPLSNPTFPGRITVANNAASGLHGRIVFKEVAGGEPFNRIDSSKYGATWNLDFFLHTIRAMRISYNQGGDVSILKGNEELATQAYVLANDSDDRLKHNETPITSALATIQKLSPQTYDMAQTLDNADDTHRGWP